MSDLCPVCGGVLQISYTITFEQGLPKAMSHSEMPDNWRLCLGHPDINDKAWLQHLAYAFYTADFDATDLSLGRPRLVWDELEEHEQTTYIRYAKVAMRLMRGKEMPS